MRDDMEKQAVTADVALEEERLKWRQEVRMLQQTIHELRDRLELTEAC